MEDDSIEPTVPLLIVIRADFDAKVFVQEAVVSSFEALEEAGTPPAEKGKRTKVKVIDSKTKVGIMPTNEIATGGVPVGMQAAVIYENYVTNVMHLVNYVQRPRVIQVH